MTDVRVKGLRDRREREAQLFEAGLKKAMPPRPAPERQPPDVPAPKPIDPEVINQTEDPIDQKPAIKSKTVWASIIGIASSILGVVTDWRVLAVLAAVIFLFILADRVFKLDIKGWFHS